MKVMSWSRNCPHCMTRRVRSSDGLSTSAMTVVDTDLGEGRRTWSNHESLLDARDPRGIDTPEIDGGSS